MKAILDELWLCSLNQSGRVELFLIVSAGTYIWNTANKNQLWGKEKRSGYVFKLIKHCLSEYSLKWLGLCLSTGQFLSKPCQNLYSKYLIHAIYGLSRALDDDWAASYRQPQHRKNKK
jgi:hypothetical protein